MATAGKFGRIFARWAPSLIIAGLVVVVFHFSGVRPPKPRLDDLLAFLAGAMLLASGLTMTFVHTVQPRRAPMPTQRATQVVNFLSGAAVMLLPMFAPPAIDPWISYGVYVGLYAICGATALMLWRGADELMRRMLSESAVIAFWILGVALSLYAGGERLGVMDGVTAWGLAAFATLANFAASFWVIWRRTGMKHLDPEDAA